MSDGDDFLRLSKALKAAGRTEMRKSLNKGLRDAVKPQIAKTREAALERLPKAGGLAAQVAKEPQRVQVRTGNTAGVRLVVGKRSGGARGANVGVIRHPVFGHKDRYVEQQVAPGWFDDTNEKAKPALTEAVQKALQDVVDKIVRGAS